MAGENPARLRWVKTLRCLCRGPGEDCSPAVEAHHAGRRGMARKAHDDTAVPLCTAHHHDFHAGTGAFRHMDKQARRAWAAAAIAATEAGWAQQQRLQDFPGF